MYHLNLSESSYIVDVVTLTVTVPFTLREAKAWKWVAQTAPDPLVAVVQTAIALGVHHPSWKQSLVAVIPKNNKKDMALPKSHHPIQLIECLGKLVEKIVARRIYFDLGKYDLMPFNQFGGRSNSSCLDAGLSLTHDIQTARKKDLVSSFLAVDIKGFFDHVDHGRLLDVLHHKGFPPNIVRWVKSFLAGCFVRVRVDDHIGDPHPQNVGVPQGSPISPVLACIYSSVLKPDVSALVGPAPAVTIPECTRHLCVSGPVDNTR